MDRIIALCRFYLLRILYVTIATTELPRGTARCTWLPHTIDWALRLTGSRPSRRNGPKVVSIEAEKHRVPDRERKKSLQCRPQDGRHWKERTRSGV